MPTGLLATNLLGKFYHPASSIQEATLAKIAKQRKEEGEIAPGAQNS